MYVGGKTIFIDGTWTGSSSNQVIDCINPATESPFGVVSAGNADDVDAAVKAARRAFPSFAAQNVEYRIELLEAIISVYQTRIEDIATAITFETGVPISMSRDVQATGALGHLQKMVEVLRTFEFEQDKAGYILRREPIGVCGLITPWNWPMSQLAAKVVPAIAAGCTIVLKPSEVAPFSAAIFGEVLHDAGVPKGVFNIVTGTGAVVGSALTEHPEVDMVSFTGSTKAGIAVAKSAAETVKRVSQELGGKSASIVLEGADLRAAVTNTVRTCFRNSGQSCNAPTRLFVREEDRDTAIAIAQAVAESFVIGDPTDEETTLGPVATEGQYLKVQGFIASGLEEGAIIVAGGLGRPEGIAAGYFVRPTVFANARDDMKIVTEEIFGPVIPILTYRTTDEAIARANSSTFGLAAYVYAKDKSSGVAVARLLEAGNVYVNDPPWSPHAPFGGYKQSGNGREFAEFGLSEYLETKAIL